MGKYVINPFTGDLVPTGNSSNTPQSASNTSLVPSGNIASVDVESALAELDTEKIGTVPSIAALKNLTPIDGQVIEALGYYAANDGGGGKFTWDSANTQSDNGGTIVAKTSGGVGRWLRIYSGVLNIRWFGARGSNSVEDTAAFSLATQHIASNNLRRTIYVPDGNYTLNSPINLSRGISLRLENKAFIRAATGFTGSALIVVDITSFGPDYLNDSIEGGNLNGNFKTAGIAVKLHRSLSIRNIHIDQCIGFGIQIGDAGSAAACYGVTIENIVVRLGVMVSPQNSVGLHFKRVTDSIAHNVVVIGYEIGVKDEGASNEFSMCHPWTHPYNGAQIYSFYCAGSNASYFQCVADTPVNGNNESYGFYVTELGYGNRFLGSRIYNNEYLDKDNLMSGVFVSPGLDPVFIGTYFFAADPTHRMKVDFAGDTSKATILATRYGNNIALKSVAGDQSAATSQVTKQITVKAGSLGKNQISIYKSQVGNLSLGGIDLLAEEQTDEAEFRFFRSTDQQNSKIIVFKGNNTATANCRLGGTGNSYLNADNGYVGLGTYDPTEKVDVLGNLKIRGGAFNSGHLLLGNYRLWLDNAGRLRIKNGIPTSDTDGSPFPNLGSKLITSNYTASLTDPALIANATSAPITIILPIVDANSKGYLPIKNVTTNSNLVTIAAATGQTIDDNSTLILSVKNVAVDLFSHAGGWYIF